jgi:hypothetical protein
VQPKGFPQRGKQLVTARLYQNKIFANIGVNPKAVHLVGISVLQSQYFRGKNNKDVQFGAKFSQYETSF